MLDRLNSFSSALEIRDFAKNNRTSKSQIEIRKSVNIAIIDDEKFQAFNNLTSYGYKITELSDITSVLDIADYDIILCDLMGIGHNFDRTIGGASIIKEIKANYPTKFVIAYTGARQNSIESSSAKKYADGFLKKDADLTRWSEELDKFIEISIDPYKMWLIARRGLLDCEIDLRDIVRIESAYVISVLKKDDDFTTVKKTLGKIDISGNAKGVIQSLVASKIFELAFAS
ncbi:hypothetical protein [Nisaea sp.]|uniref:hypothetical protein n=1 Tax=Nisaea sp. TaxID=2024842 RepID=UPI003296FDCB